MVSIPRPEILFLSLANQSFFDESYSSLIDSLRSSFELKRGKTANGVMRYLATKNPKAILITDEGLTTTESGAVLDQLFSYVRNGGLIIVGFHFPTFVQFDDFNKLFKDGFGLPWQRGDYRSANFQFNPSCSLLANLAVNSLPAPYIMKALHVKNAEPHQKIFVPITDDETQSPVFPPEYVKQTQAAVVGTKIGEGFMVYIGDVNPTKESFDIILQLCGS